MARSRSKPPHQPALALPGYLALVSVVALAGIMMLGGFKPSAQQAMVAVDYTEIGVEHASPLTLTLTMTRGRTPALVDIEHASDGIAFISLPDTWELREVRKAALANIAHDPDEAGFRRWHVPSGVTLSFHAPSIEHVRVHNPSKIPLHVDYKKIDLATNKVIQDSALSTGKPVTF